MVKKVREFVLLGFGAAPAAIYGVPQLAKVFLVIFENSSLAQQDLLAGPAPKPVLNDLAARDAEPRRIASHRRFRH